MALIGINQPKPREEGKDIWDKIALSLQIANNALGAGLAIPKWLAEKKLAEGAAAREEKKYGLEVGKAQSEFDKTFENAPSVPGVAGTLNPTGSFENPIEKPFTPPEANPLAFKADRPEIGREGHYVPRADPSKLSTLDQQTLAIQKQRSQGNVMVQYRDPQTDAVTVTIVPEKEFNSKPGKYTEITDAPQMKNATTISGSAMRVLSAGYGQQKDVRDNFQSTFKNVKARWEKIKSTLGEEKAVYEAADDMLKPDNLNRVTAGAVGGLIARTLAKEKGVLTEQDIARIMPGSLSKTVGEIYRWIMGNENNVIPSTIIGATRDAIGGAIRGLKRRMALDTYNALAEEASVYGDFFQDQGVQQWEKVVKSQVPGFDRAKKIMQLRMVMDESPDPEVDARAQERINTLESGW